MTIKKSCKSARKPLFYQTSKRSFLCAVFSRFSHPFKKIIKINKKLIKTPKRTSSTTTKMNDIAN